MERKEDTPVRKTRRKYKEKNKEKRKQASERQFRNDDTKSLI